MKKFWFGNSLFSEAKEQQVKILVYILFISKFRENKYIVVYFDGKQYYLIFNKKKIYAWRNLLGESFISTRKEERFDFWDN